MFELLGLEPNRSSSANAILALQEESIGRKFPAAVREWYELEDACQLMLAYSNGDRSVDIDKLGNVDTDSRSGDRYDLLAQNLLVFRWENQGVCAWAVRLDGSDDPPVVVDVDTQFRSWLPCADSFSQHLYSCAWDWGRVLNCELIVQAQNKPLSEATLHILKQQFQPEVVTYNWPGDVQYRFYNDQCRILIWAGKDQADWNVVADTPDHLEQLVRSLAQVDSLVDAFWSHTESGEAVLRKIRG